MNELELHTGKFVGARVKRVEDPRLLTGTARYIADITLPRELHCAFVRSTHPHARLGSVDSSAAAAMPGVVAVITGRDLDTEALTDRMPRLTVKTPQPALPTDRTRFVGQALAVVLASSRALAEDAAEAVTVNYEPLGHVTDVLESMSPDAPRLFDHLGSNVLFSHHEKIGDPDRAFAQADHILERRFRTNRFMAAPMEGRGVIAEFQRHSGRLTMWSSTQTPHLLRVMLATGLKLPSHRIRVITPEVGGGFGQKMVAYPEEVAVGAAAMLLGRPVKWIEDRRENLLSATHAKQQTIDIAIALRADGVIQAIRGTYIGDTGAFSFTGGSALIEPLMPVGLLPNTYRVRDFEVKVLAVLTNKTPIGPYRGVGWTAGHTAREVLLDEAARALGLEPTELRRRNMLDREDFPYRSPTGPLYDSGSYRESLEEVAAKVDIGRFRREQAAARQDGIYLGLGVNPWVEPTAFGTEAGIQNGYPISSHDNARVTMDPTGKVFASIAIPSQGQAHETTFAQIVADGLGVELEDVVVSSGDTDVDPWAGGTYTSRGAVVAAGALGLAAREVRTKLLDAASRMLEADPRDLQIETGKVSVVGSPDVGVALADVARAAYFDSATRDEHDAGLSATRFYDPRATYSNGCIGVIVAVDIETGKVDVQRIVAVEDCGKMLNPSVIEGQMMGAVAQGIGGALLEELVYEPDGQLVTTTYLDYLLPLATEVPRMELSHLESPSPFTFGGVKGMGESGLISTPAAVVAAVEDALAPFGARFDHLPITPDRVLRAIGVI
jgi:carbon-monoxide dehydrogenase large subunit